MLIYLWQRPDEAVDEVESSAGGPGRFHKKKRVKRTPYDLPPVDETTLPPPKRPTPPPIQVKRGPKRPPKATPYIDIQRLIKQPKDAPSLKDLLNKDLRLKEVPIVDFELPPRVLKPVAEIQIEEIPVEELPAAEVLDAPIETPVELKSPSVIKEVLKTPENNVALATKEVPPVVIQRPAGMTDEELILWIAAAEGFDDAFYLLTTV